MAKNKRFYIDNVMLGAIPLVLATTMIFSISLSVQAEPATVSRGECNIGSENGEPDDVFVNGEGPKTTNDNGRHSGCHGQADNPPTSGGARVDEIEGGDTRCHGVATPSGQGNFVCNTNNNRK